METGLIHVVLLCKVIIFFVGGLNEIHVEFHLNYICMSYSVIAKFSSNGIYEYYAHHISH